MVQIKQMLVSSRAVTSGGGNPCNYIVIHETANTSKGANAYMHAELQRNGFTASWHYTVDDKEIYQSFPDNVKCWHAGDGGSGKGNGQGIGIEICVNSDGDFKKAVENAVELVKHLMKKHGIKQENVIQHNVTSSWGKNCPANLRSGKIVSWADFNRMIRGSVGTVSAPKTETKPSVVNKPSSKPKKQWTKVNDDWTGQTLGNGEYGVPVGQLQNKLVKNGYLKPSQVDDYFGDDTEKAVRQVQKDAGITSDGLAGKNTFLALIIVDGKWGVEVNIALQLTLGTYADGILSGQPNNAVTKAMYGGVEYGTKGSPAVGAFQKKVGAPSDKKIGPDTIGYAQKHLGTPFDKKLSRPSAMVKELQRRLKARTF